MIISLYTGDSLNIKDICAPYVRIDRPYADSFIILKHKIDYDYYSNITKQITFTKPDLEHLLHEVYKDAYYNGWKAGMNGIKIK